MRGGVSQAGRGSLPVPILDPAQSDMAAPVNILNFRQATPQALAQTTILCYWLQANIQLRLSSVGR